MKDEQSIPADITRLPNVPLQLDLLYSDNFKQDAECIFTTNGTQISNTFVEQQYGPFPIHNTEEDISPIGSPLINSPRPISSPRPRLEDTTLQDTQNAIDLLRKKIAEAEAKRNAAAIAALATLAAEAPAPIPDVIPVIETSLPAAINEVPPISMREVPPVIDEEAPVENNEETTRSKSTPIILIDSDDDDNMSIDTESDKASVASNKSASSVETFHSAIENLSQAEVSSELNALLEKEKLAEEMIQQYSNKLKQAKSVTEDINLKILGVKVRMSFNKSKNSLRNSKTASTPPESPLGSKRDFFAMNGGEYEGSRQQRRYDYDPYMVNGYYYPQPQPLYMPYAAQPPPLPVGLPPAVPPPPPPPPFAFPAQPPPPPPPSAPATTTAAAPPARRKEAESEQMENAQQVESILKEMEQLILFRIFGGATDHPYASEGSLARPLKLINIDNYTMPMNTLILNEKKDEQPWTPPSKEFTMPAGMPIVTKMDDSWYESPFFSMLRRMAVDKPFTSKFAPILKEIMTSVSPNDDLSTIKIGSFYFVNLETPLQIVRRYCFEQPDNEYLAALKLELSHYVNRSSKIFMDDVKNTLAKFPLSVDVEWQIIRAEVMFSNQLPLILDLLHRISSTHKSGDSKESQSVSRKTAEILVRLIRLPGGFKHVIRLLTNRDVDIDSESEQIFDIYDAPGLHLQEQEQYGLWMMILYYYIFRTLPDDLSSIWMTQLAREGSSVKSISTFMIDFNTCEFLAHPLPRATLCGATNIMLSMLRHFGKKAINNVKKRPLLVGVWRTLINFLSNINQYRIAGTLVLVRKAKAIIKQMPETQEIIAALETRMGSGTNNIIENVFAAKPLMSSSNIYSLTYHAACAYYEKHPYTPHHLLVTSTILLLPLPESKRKENMTDLVRRLDADHQDQVEQIRDIVLDVKTRYLNTLGFGANPPKSTKVRKSAVAWINLLLLMQISKFLYPKTGIIRDTIDRDIQKIKAKGLAEVDAGDGKLFIRQYASLL